MNVFIVCERTECSENPPPGTEIVGDPKHSLYNRYGAAAGCLYLIRPDGYVAYRDRQANHDSLQRYVKRVFGQ